MLSAALLFYDSVLTFADEVELLWRGKLGVPFVLFVMNRISAALFVLWIILQDLDDVRLPPSV